MRLTSSRGTMASFAAPLAGRSNANGSVDGGNDRPIQGIIDARMKRLANWPAGGATEPLSNLSQYILRCLPVVYMTSGIHEFFNIVCSEGPAPISVGWRRCGEIGSQRGDDQSNERAR